MVVLARIQERFRLSLGSYRRQRMTEAVRELNLYIGQRCVGAARGRVGC